LSALDDGELEDCDLVALALAVDQSAFTAEVTGGRHPAQRRSASNVDKPPRQSVDTGQRRRESSLVASEQVMHWTIYRSGLQWRTID